MVGKRGGGWGALNHNFMSYIYIQHQSFCKTIHQSSQHYSVLYIYLFFLIYFHFVGKMGFTGSPWHCLAICTCPWYTYPKASVIYSTWIQYLIKASTKNKQISIVQYLMFVVLSFCHNIQLLTIDIVSKSISLNFYIIRPTSFMSSYQSYESSHKKALILHAFEDLWELIAKKNKNIKLFIYV